MGWLDRHKQADGKSDEQSKAEMDQLVERLGASFEEKLNARLEPLTTTVTALKTDWESIKTEATKTDTTPRNADGTPRELTDDEKRNNREAATVGLVVQANARLTERDVLDEIPSGWKHIVPDVRKMFADTPIQRKAQPDYAEYCRNIVTLVIGNAARKAGLSTSDNGGSFFLEDKSGSSTEQGGVLSDPSLAWRKNDGSTESASETLRKLGIAPKDFEESVKRGVV